jgi:hypothetical protein
MAKHNKKAAATKVVEARVAEIGNQWTVHFGRLARRQGNPGKAEHLFKAVGEKLPYAALNAVKKDMKQRGLSRQGVYIAHDSMGFPRYIGRGSIFGRLRTRLKAQPLELSYFSFYVVTEKKHEREIETLLIRAAGPLLEFNSKKKRVGIGHGNIKDFEAGTLFYERQRKKGKRQK